LAKSTALVLSREGGSISGQMSFHRGLFQKREKRKEKDFNGEVTEKEKEQKSYFDGEGFGTKKEKERRPFESQPCKTTQQICGTLYI
jgi:hypothetical protein